MGVALGDAEGVAVADGDGDAALLGLRVGLAVAETVALGDSRRVDSLGSRGPPESASATTVPVSAASPIITA